MILLAHFMDFLGSLVNRIISYHKQIPRFYAACC